MKEKSLMHFWKTLLESWIQFKLIMMLESTLQIIITFSGLFGQLNLKNTSHQRTESSQRSLFQLLTLNDTVGYLKNLWIRRNQSCLLETQEQPSQWLFSINWANLIQSKISFWTSTFLLEQHPAISKRQLKRTLTKEQQNSTDQQEEEN